MEHLPTMVLHDQHRFGIQPATGVGPSHRRQAAACRWPRSTPAAVRTLADGGGDHRRLAERAGVRPLDRRWGAPAPREWPGAGVARPAGHRDHRLAQCRCRRRLPPLPARPGCRAGNPTQGQDPARQPCRLLRRDPRLRGRAPGRRAQQGAPPRAGGTHPHGTERDRVSPAHRGLR